MDNISFMFCHIVIPVYISNCHHRADFCRNQCEVFRIPNILHENCRKQVRKSASFSAKLVYTQTGSYLASCSPWNIHGLGCFCNYLENVNPPKNWKISRFQIHEWDIMKQEETALTPHCPISPNILNPLWLGTQVLSSKGEMERILIFHRSLTLGWSTRGLWVSHGLNRQWNVGQNYCNYCWRFRNPASTSWGWKVEILLFTGFL